MASHTCDLLYTAVINLTKQPEKGSIKPNANYDNYINKQENSSDRIHKSAVNLEPNSRDLSLKAFWDNFLM